MDGVVTLSTNKYQAERYIDILANGSWAKERRRVQRKQSVRLVGNGDYNIPQRPTLVYWMLPSTSLSPKIASYAKLRDVRVIEVTARLWWDAELQEWLMGAMLPNGQFKVAPLTLTRLCDIKVTP